MAKNPDSILLSWQLPTIFGVLAALLVVTFRRVLLTGMSMYMQVLVVVLVSVLVSTTTRMLQDRSR